ncbi:LOW QUALITY PROTEIN: ecdysone oxidase-like [Aphomia sociella]
MSTFMFETNMLLLLLLLVGARGDTESNEPSYDMPNSVILKDGDTFEYIVVGAGAAGAAAAARLALAGAHVLLVEAGGNPNLISRIPGAAMALLGSTIDYHYDTISNNMSCLSSVGKACQASRGKCLGGSTSINYMMYVRGNRNDFDSLNISGWSWNDMKPYFLRYEGLQDLDLLPASSIPYHNTTGTMKVEFFAKFDNPWHSRVIEGYKTLNFPYDPDINAISQIGVSQVMGYTYQNQRMSTARGYLGRDDVKSKLKVAKYTRCTGVIIDDDNVTRGVTVVTGLLRKLRLYATREVVLSAGALVTPQLLMLSGIGPAEHLKEFDIPVRADLSVGDNMTDHTLALIFIKVEKNLLEGIFDNTGKIFSSLEDLILSGGSSLASIGLTDVTVFVNTLCYDFEKHQLTNSTSDCELPTTQFIHAYMERGLLKLGAPFLPQSVGWNSEVIKQLADISENYVILLTSSLVLQTKSQGTVRLASADPFKQPAIFPNYLADSQDIEEIVRGVRIIQDLSNTSIFKGQGASVIKLNLEGCPDSSDDSDEYWSCYARHMTFSTFHSVGTTAINRVVNTRLSVKGISGLRVADAGVMPKLPRGNTAASCIAIGERVADFILEDNANSDIS